MTGEIEYPGELIDLEEIEMSEHRFEIAFSVLEDCFNHFHDNQINKEEQDFRKRLVQLCSNICLLSGLGSD